MKHARFLLKFRPSKPSSCPLEPQYLGDLKSRFYSLEYSRSQNPQSSDLEMREAIIPSPPVMFLLHYSWTRLAVWGVAPFCWRIISIFSECCINPGNLLVLQQVQIHMLVHLNPFFSEDEGSILSDGSYPGPDHNRSRGLSVHVETSQVFIF